MALALCVATLGGSAVAFGPVHQAADCCDGQGANGGCDRGGMHRAGHWEVKAPVSEHDKGRAHECGALAGHCGGPALGAGSVAASHCPIGKAKVAPAGDGPAASRVLDVETPPPRV